MDKNAPHQISVIENYIQAQETHVMHEHIANVFGFYALQLGWPTEDLLAHTRIPNQIHTIANSVDVACESEWLPFANQSIDLVCMPHLLELCDHPHQTLREIERVLVAEGVVVITGFRPSSILGKRIRWHKPAKFSAHQRLLSMRRVTDWLALLGLECIASGTLAHAYPINDAGWIKRMSFLDRWGPRLCGVAGSAYYIVAKKRVMNMRLLKPDWKSQAFRQTLIVTNPKSSSQKQLSYRDGNTTVD